MGLLTDYSGIGSPRPKWQHQITITRAVRTMFDELDEQNLILVSEATVTDDWDDLVPDLVVFNNSYAPLMIIEITTHRDVRAIMRKCKELMTRFSDVECFVFDYEWNILHQFSPEYNKWLSSEEYDLYSAFLSKPVIKYMQ